MKKVAKLYYLSLVGLFVLSLLVSCSDNFIAPSAINQNEEEVMDNIYVHRMADLTVNVKDNNGQNIDDAEVQVEMKKHAFPFGTAVRVDRLFGLAESDPYKVNLKKYFNKTTLGNGHKWKFWEQDETAIAKIQAEAIDNSTAFANSSGNLSFREKTSAEVTWNIPFWYKNEAGADQKTPDLSSVIQEVIDRPGWTSGNRLAILVKPYKGKRKAYSYDDNDINSVPPTLTINYNSTESLVVSIVSSLGDIEQSDDHFETGNDSVRADDEDLDLADEYVGLQFVNITIPQGATIDSASIQFKADRDSENKREQTDSAMTWLQDNDFKIKGHTLVWQTYDWATPYDLYVDGVLENDKDYVKDRINGHIDSIVPIYADSVDSWDVLNEPSDIHALTDFLAEGSTHAPPEAVQWFNRTKNLDPDASLSINDYGILVGNNWNLTDYKKIIDYLVTQDAAIDAIGLQCHFFEANLRNDSQRMYDVLDELAQFGLDIEITEFDMYGTGWTDEMEAEFMRTFLSTAFSHPSVSSITLWGFWDGQHWTGNAPLFDASWNLKPSGQAYEDLVLGEWWTDESGQTSSGRYRTSGFKGDYTITVTVGSEIKTMDISLEEAKTIDFVFP